MDYMTSFYEQVGSRIKSHRELLGLNQDEIGTPELGYIQNNLMWSIEKGEMYGENKSFLTKKNLKRIIEGFRERICEINNSSIDRKIDLEITEISLLLGNRLEIYDFVHELYNYIAYNFEYLPKSHYKSKYYNNHSLLSKPSRFLKFTLCFSATYAINQFFLNNHESALHHGLDYDFNDSLLDNHQRMIDYFWIMRSNELIESFVNWFDQQMFSDSIKKISDYFFNQWITDEFIQVVYNLYLYFSKFEKYQLGYYCEDKLRTYSNEAIELYKYINDEEFNVTEKFRQHMFGEQHASRLDKIKDNFSHLFHLAENQDMQFLNVYLREPVYYC